MRAIRRSSTQEVSSLQTESEPGSPFDFWILEARLLLTQFLRRAAPEFAAHPTSTHTSHEFCYSGLDERSLCVKD
jgi:hypothetical protein